MIHMLLLLHLMQQQLLDDKRELGAAFEPNEAKSAPEILHCLLLPTERGGHMLTSSLP